MDSKLTWTYSTTTLHNPISNNAHITDRFQLHMSISYYFNNITKMLTCGALVNFCDVFFSQFLVKIESVIWFRFTQHVYARLLLITASFHPELHGNQNELLKTVLFCTCNFTCWLFYQMCFMPVQALGVLQNTSKHDRSATPRHPGLPWRTRQVKQKAQPRQEL